MDESFALPWQLVAVSVLASSRCTVATARPVANLPDNCRPVAVCQTRVGQWPSDARESGSLLHEGT